MCSLAVFNSLLAHGSASGFSGFLRRNDGNISLLRHITYRILFGWVIARSYGVFCFRSFLLHGILLTAFRDPWLLTLPATR